MKRPSLHLLVAGFSLLIVFGTAGGLWAGGVLTADGGDPAAATAGVADLAAGDTSEPAQAGSSSDPLIYSYSAKFVCLEPLQPGTLYFGLAAPVVHEKT